MFIAGKSKPGQVTEPRADLRSVKGFDAGQPVVCPGMDARKPLTAVPERPACLAALNTASFHGGDDFAGSARATDGFLGSATGGSSPATQRSSDPCCQLAAAGWPLTSGR